MHPDDEDDDDESSGPVREPDPDETARLVDEVFAASEDWTALPNRLITAAQSAGYDVDGAAVAAVRRGTRVVLRRKDEPGRRSEVALEPLAFPLDGREPTRPRDADPEAAALWRHIADTVRHPAARARFLDLLVLRGGRDVPADAAAAARAYLELAVLGRYELRVADSPNGEVLTETRAWTLRSVELAVGRALTLAPIAASAPDGAAAAADALQMALGLAEAALDENVPAGGTCLSMLRLAAAARGQTPADTARLAGLADRLLEQQTARPFLIDGAAAVLSGLDPARRADTDEARIRARMLEADGDRPPAVRLVLLEKAAALAHRLGRKDLAAEATRAMQAIDQTTLGLAKITAEGSIPAEIVDVEVERMSAGSTWQDALDSWLASGSPTGDPDANDREVRRLVAVGGLRRLLPTVLLGADGLPRWHARGEQDELDSDLAWTEKHHISFRGRMLADALDRVGALGRPDPDDLALHLSDRGAGHLPLAAATARALIRYWDGDYEACLHTAVPRIEAAARELVLSLDIAAYQVARTSDPGKYVGLGALIGLLADAGLDRSWERFLRTLLTGPLGMNVRNDTAHGFVIADPGRENAALALRALGLLVRLLGPPANLAAAPPDPLPGCGKGTVVFAAASLVRAATQRPGDIPGLLLDEARVLRRLLGRRRS